MKYVFLFLILNLCLQCPRAQGLLYYSDTLSGGTNEGLIQSLEGGYLMHEARSYQAGSTWKKLDATGQTTWSYNGPSRRVVQAVQIPSDSSYLFFIPNTSAPSADLVRVDQQGQVVGTHVVPYNSSGGGNQYYWTSIYLTADEHLLLTHNVRLPGQMRYRLGVQKVTLSGQGVWQQVYPAHPDTARYYLVPMAVETTGGAIFLITNSVVLDSVFQRDYENYRAEVLALDSAGVEQWRSTILPTEQFAVFGAERSQNGGLLLLGQIQDTCVGGCFGNQVDPFACKINAQGNVEWQYKDLVNNNIVFPNQSIAERYTNAIEDAQGNWTLSGHSHYLLDIHFTQLTATGGFLRKQKLYVGIYPSFGYVHDLVPSLVHTNHYIVYGRKNNHVFLSEVDSLGRSYSNALVGKHWYDLNVSCTLDASDSIGRGMRIISRRGRSYSSAVDPDGGYYIELDTGRHVFEQHTRRPNEAYCQGVQSIYLNGGTDTLDFGIRNNPYGLLEVSLSTSFVRRCFPFRYQVRYENRSAQTIPDAYVDVRLDPYLSYDSSSIPLSTRVGNVFRFELDTLPPSSQGTFWIAGQVACDSNVLGQVHCVEAHIHPDTLPAPYQWVGPHVVLADSCSADSVFFIVRNIGSTMAAPQAYRLIEDQTIVQTGTVQLGANATQTFTLPRRLGRLYRIEVDQVPNFPFDLGDNIAIRNNLNCGQQTTLTAPSAQGFYYNGNISPFVAVDCQSNRGSYDPNDKQAQPIGYGPSHFIENNTPLHYRIRFQNTGTDTAFTVVILDTLDANLDTTSIRLGASSHPYTWSLNNGVLEVRYDNIMLPDSNVNEPLSHGFIKFQIQQQPDLPDGTVLTNRAAIYFDFNALIITNEVFHTIGSNFVALRLVGLEEPLVEHLDVQLYPNPFQQTATLVVEGETYEQLAVDVYSIAGQHVATFSGSGQQVTLERRNLPAGLYLYRLVGDGARLATGKMVVE